MRSHVEYIQLLYNLLRAITVELCTCHADDGELCFYEGYYLDDYVYIDILRE